MPQRAAVHGRPRVGTVQKGFDTLVQNSTGMALAGGAWALLLGNASYWQKAMGQQLELVAYLKPAQPPAVAGPSTIDVVRDEFWEMLAYRQTAW